MDRVITLNVKLMHISPSLPGTIIGIPSQRVIDGSFTDNHALELNKLTQ